MNSEILNARILKLTLFIQTHHPELSKYLEEFPVTIPNEEQPKINLRILEEYLNTLISFMKKYELKFEE